MAYKSTAELDRRIDRLSTPSNSSNWGAILGDALKSYKANKLGKEREAIQEQNELNQQRELAMILRGQQTGRVGDSYASATADQFSPSDPALREITAKMLMERSSMGGDLQNKMALERYKSSLPNSGEYALSPVTFRNPDGTYSFGQLNKAGGLKLIETPQGLQYVPDSGRLGFNPANINERGNADNAVAAARQGAVGDIQTQQAIEQAAGVEQARIDAIPDRAAAELQAERSAQRPQAEARAATAQRQAEMVNGYIDSAKQLASNWSTGWGSKLSALPSTDAKDLSALVDSIKANVGFQQLQEMRSQSPTGAALGAVQVQELVYLQSVLGNLDQAQSKEQFMQNLQNVQDAINAIVNGTQEQFEGTYGGTRQPATPASNAPPSIAPGAVLRFDALGNLIQ